MSYTHLSRRELLVTGGSLFISSIAPAAPSFAQTDADAKDLNFHTTAPRNAEPELRKLVESWITPTKHFYVRSHGTNPTVDPAQFRLRVEGLVRQPLSMTLPQLLDMSRQTITATLTCAGNRRVEFSDEKDVGGVQWRAGAVGNASWTGLGLAPLLMRAGLLENAQHVWFEGLDQVEHEGGDIPFGASIPIEKALLDGPMPGAMLAYKMNSADLTQDHGFPLRAIVPGYIGARSVKWLGRIVVSDRPSPNHFVAEAYKLVRDTEPIDWKEAGPIYRYPINAALATPQNGVLRAGALEITGYVLPSGRAGARVKRVEVSVDDGKTWTPAELKGEATDFCWQLWNARVDVARSTRQMIVRASDDAGDFMPPHIGWNAKGYLQNSWYRVGVKVN